MDLQILVSPGELIDRLTILEIKRARIPEQGKRERIDHALAALLTTVSENIPSTPRLVELSRELASVNVVLWQAEDDLRNYERRQTFDQRFIESARMVYLNNDRRSELKRHINELLGSALLEEKFYSVTQDSAPPLGHGQG